MKRIGDSKRSAMPPLGLVRDGQVEGPARGCSETRVRRTWVYLGGAEKEAKDEKIHKERRPCARQLDAGIIASQWATGKHGDRNWRRKKGEGGQNGRGLCVWEWEVVMRLCFPYVLPSTLSFQVRANKKEAWRGVPKGRPGVISGLLAGDVRWGSKTNSVGTIQYPHV